MENEALFISILNEELIPAMGCTEPIALAYAAAKARELLFSSPTKIIARCSGNIIKNVRCVAIPNSDGMIGIEAAVALGAFGGKAALGMEVRERTGPPRYSKIPLKRCLHGRVSQLGYSASFYT